MISLNVQTVI